MRIWIDIDSMGEQIAKFSNNIESLRSIITRSVAEEVYRQWVYQASINLNRGRQEYIDEIFIDEISANVFEVGIPNDGIAAKLEGGSPSYDMKIGFSKSPKAKKKKGGGWYLTIPFRIGTPNANNSGGQFSNIMPRSVFNEVRKAIKNNTKIELPPKYNVLSKPHHKSPIFAGINAVPNSSGGTSYNTFRRVSDKSDPSSWIHPATIGKHVLEKVLNNIDIDQIIKQTIERLA